jgi:hypothetical protein
MNIPLIYTILFGILILYIMFYISYKTFAYGGIKVIKRKIFFTKLLITYIILFHNFCSFYYINKNNIIWLFLFVFAISNIRTICVAEYRIDKITKKYKATNNQ